MLNKRFIGVTVGALLLHFIITWQLLNSWKVAPELVVEMSSAVASQAQVFYDIGAGWSEAESSTVPVSGGGGLQTLRLPLPNGEIERLRFDPLMVPGIVVLKSVAVVPPGGSALPARVQILQGVEAGETASDGTRYRIPPGSNDPQFILSFDKPLTLNSRMPGGAMLLRTAPWNGLLLLAEALLVLASWRPRKVGILVGVHALASVACFELWTSPPVLLVQMSSTVYSRAQVYYDAGSSMSEDQSSSAPVRPSSTLQEYRLPLPNKMIKYLRFDPLTCPGTIVIGRIDVLRSDGATAHSFSHSRIKGTLGFDEVGETPLGLRYHVRSDSYDPELVLELDAPLDLTSRRLGSAFFLRLALVNLVVFAAELLVLFCLRFAHRIPAASGGFLPLDRLAIWFYIACVTLFLILSAAGLNGSSMGVFWRNYKVGAPPRIVAGTPQQIRADEFNYDTPGILNQVFREDRMDVHRSAFGDHDAALLSALPVRHLTTLARPQYWPFFALPADLAFATWWQAKWLIFLTGVFTLFLVLTRNSFLAITGALWLFFSQFTQWCYTWPSMLPEMAGLFCFTLVCAFYLTVGARPWKLALAAFGCSVCAINFAMMAYVPHLLPYAWAGVFLMTAWCFAHRPKIFSRVRLPPIAGCLALTGILLFLIAHDAKDAITGIAATVYPGHRSLNGGGFSLATFGTHFLAASESDIRFPPEYSNINESAGFLWLAPVTLLCIGSLRELPRERRILLAGLCAGAVLLAGWMIFPVPAWLGSYLFLDRVQAIRMVPALGLLNVAIVMVVLSSSVRPRFSGLLWKTVLCIGGAAVFLNLANTQVHNYFSASQILVAILWAGTASALLWDNRRRLFAVLVVIPNLLLFGLINPVERGIDTITKSTLFEVVQSNRQLLHGKWLVFSDGFPASVFIAVGCDVYNGSKYLPDVDHFPLLAAHGLDTKILNNLGYIDIEQLKPGQPPTVRRGPFGVVMGLSPLDPLLKEMGIRYLAFHKRPSDGVLTHLRPLSNGDLSEFWLYEIE